MLSNLWWILFFVALSGNVYGWGLTLLRVLQSLDGLFAKMCLLAQLAIPVGFVLAFLFGWRHGNVDRHRRVMWVWSASILLFVSLVFWEPGA